MNAGMTLLLILQSFSIILLAAIVIKMITYYKAEKKRAQEALVRLKAELCTVEEAILDAEKFPETNLKYLSLMRRRSSIIDKIEEEKLNLSRAIFFV